MKKYVSLIGACSLCAACATVGTTGPDFGQTAQQWIGHPESELIAAKGAPTKTITRSYEDGTLIEKTLEYSGAAATGDTPAMAQRMRATLINGQWVMLPEESYSSPGKSGRIDCTLTFKVDAARMVRSWHAEGKDCPGQAPE